MYTKALSYLDLDVLSQACTVQGVFPRPEKVRITTNYYRILGLRSDMLGVIPGNQMGVTEDELN